MRALKLADLFRNNPVEEVKKKYVYIFYSLKLIDISCT